MTKQLVTRQIHDADADINGCPLDKAIKSLQNLKKTHGEGCFISVYQDYDDHYSLALFKKELENDLEYEIRLKAERKQQEWKRIQYERLKKEFELATTKLKGTDQ